MSQFRDVLILLNILVVAGILGFVAYRIVSLRRNPEEKEPQNLERFYDDDVLEGPHLERVLGVALVALVIATIAFIAYFIWEPFRGADASRGLQGPRHRAGRDPVRQRATRRVRRHQVAALRQLPWPRRRWRLGDLRGEE